MAVSPGATLETASGWRVQVRSQFASQVSRLWPERPQKYSRALLETHVKVLPFGQRHTGFCKNLKRGQHAFRRDATRRQPL